MTGYRQRLFAAGCAVLAVAGLSACGSSGSGTHDEPPHRDSNARQLVGDVRAIHRDPAAAAQLAKDEQAFSLALLRQVGSASSGGSANVSTSPESLAVALSMLANGASGQTKAQLDQALHTTGLSAQQVDAGWLAMLDAWKQDGHVTLSSANAAWLQKGFAVKQAFLDTIESYYGAGVWQTDFAGHMAAALAAINSWTSGNTHGKITKLFDNLDPSTLLVLANAVYFKAEWESPFDPKDTSPGSFTLASGQQVTTPFLNDEQGDFPAVVGDGYQAVQLPYSGGRFAALAVMPTSGTLADFVRGLDTGKLDQIVTSLHEQPVQLALPKFTTTSTLNLQATLAALGMPIAFTDRADFAGLTAKQVQIGQVVQRVYLSVAEKGTEAAAATGVAIQPGAAQVPPSLHVQFDHPFLFLIRDTQTGAILFASQIQDPTAS
jgi:serpin B